MARSQAQIAMRLQLLPADLFVPIRLFIINWSTPPGVADNSQLSVPTVLFSLMVLGVVTGNRGSNCSNEVPLQVSLAPTS